MLPKVVILAAGRGTRMGDLTESKQKTMLEINEKPLLHITFDNFVDQNFKEFVFVVGYRKEDIIDYFDRLITQSSTVSKYDGVKVWYIEQENPKGGTADAVGVTKDVVASLTLSPKANPHPNALASHFVLVYGDVVPFQSTVSILANFVESQSRDSDNALMITRKVENPERYGMVEILNDRILAIHEKSKNPPTPLGASSESKIASNMINAGLYVLPLNMYKFILSTPKSERGEYELTTSLELFMKAGGIIEYICVGGVCGVGGVGDDKSLIDVGTKDEYIKLK